jgi:hypothetical protein
MGVSLGVSWRIAPRKNYKGAPRRPSGNIPRPKSKPPRPDPDAAALGGRDAAYCLTASAVISSFVFILKPYCLP